MANKRNLYHDVLEQLEFLSASCAGYDAGMTIEAKRLAVTIRVLVHDTAASHSLLAQLGVKETLKWISAGRVDPRNLLSSSALTMMRYSGDGRTEEFTPYMHKDEQYLLERGIAVTFQEWWGDVVIKDADGEKFTRRDLVLALANKDGGAHVDDLQTRVRKLAHEGSIGWLFGPVPQEGQADNLTLAGELITLNPILAAVRTIAEELRLVLFNQLKEIETAA